MTAPDAALTWADFGWWPHPDGQRRLLSWNAATKELKFWGVNRLDADEVLGLFESEVEVRFRLVGWAKHNDTPGGLAWLRQRLEGQK